MLTDSLPDHLADIDQALSAACGVMRDSVEDIDCSRPDRCSLDSGDTIEIPVSVAFSLHVTHASEIRGQLLAQFELLVELLRGAV